MTFRIQTQTSVQREEYSHLQTQHRQRTNSKILQAAKTNTACSTHQKYQIQCSKPKTEWPFSEQVPSLFCALCFSDRIHSAETTALNTNSVKKVQTHCRQFELAVLCTGLSVSQISALAGAEQVSHHGVWRCSCSCSLSAGFKTFLFSYSQARCQNGADIRREMVIFRVSLSQT